MPLISIIIPIYKSENYIQRCVKSLMEQTMINLEYIFINDNTPDNTMEILHKTILKYPDRIKQITIIENKFNLGPSESRKRGIEIAKGKYIACCDADDWIEKDMYETLYNCTIDGEIDIVVSNYIIENNKQIIHKFTPCSTPQEALKFINNNNRFSFSMCNQIIRTTIVREEIKHIFPTRFREDTFLLMRLYYKSVSIKYISNAFYHYYKENENSLCKNRIFNYNSWNEQKINIERIANLLYSNDGYKLYHWSINQFKYNLKLEYKSIFKNRKSFFYTFYESHSDIIYLNNINNNSILNKIKTYLVHKYYIFFLIHSIIKK